MRTFYIISLIIISFAVSCNSLNKSKYTILIHSKEPSLLGNGVIDNTDSSTSEYESDSAAYFNGVLKYEISKAVEKELKFGKVTYDFEVLNESRENIKYKLTPSLISKLEQIATEAANKSGENLSESLKKSDSNSKAVEETTEIKELKKKFRVKKDEFDENNLQWYEHKSSPNYRNRNGLYCYFSTKNGVPNKLRFVHQYYSEDWLFIRRYKFSIDDKAFTYTPYKVETDSGDGGMVWEWSDEVVDTETKEIIDALLNCKAAKIRLEGSQYYDVKAISSSQIKAIKETVELFKLMGGSY